MSVEAQLLDAVREAVQAFCKDRGRVLDERPDAVIMIPLFPGGILAVPVIGLLAAPDAGVYVMDGI